MFWQTELGEALRSTDAGTVAIRQESSGGENWQSRNHVDRHGRVPCRFRGYIETSSLGERRGLRASPIVTWDDGHTSVSVAVPNFWQQFPKSIAASADGIEVGLFPQALENGEPFELQGGERKTHTVWMLFEPSPEKRTELGLSWVHSPPQIRLSPEYVASTGVLDPFLPALDDPDPRLRQLLDEALEGPKSFFAGREAIDEYGWRNYGETWANHEEQFYDGPKPIISHYNNQFDVVYGAIVQWLRTGDMRWREVFEPLARHVMDVDIYHTNRDRAGYNGGLFWFTDHYLEAHTSTHRTYSRHNQQPGRPYGGGPGSEHNYARGLAHYYYLTGDEDAREAVLGLANWVVNMDDGAQSIFGGLDGGPTGRASATGAAGIVVPGRGAANSIDVLLDAWQLSRMDKYLAKAEELIRRCIGPLDDVAGMHLLDFEAHWSYTMFLAALARYLDVKAEAGALDEMYAYGQASLVHYARWMAEHEQPYFDRREAMEYPTEAWAAQEFRKANALWLAAQHAEGATAEEFCRRAKELSERAWNDLLAFDTRSTTRSLAVMMTEGVRDAWFRVHGPTTRPQAPLRPQFSPRAEFVPQRVRVMNKLRTPRGIGELATMALRPKVWRHWLSLWRRRRGMA